VPISFNKSRKRDDEIDRAVEKLKRLYTKYASLYSERLFNLKGFEARYRNALEEKVNLNSFLHAEIIAFEELKQRVELKIEEKKAPQSPSESTYSEVADRIIEENLGRIRKYPHIDFHPDAEEEAAYLLGAATDFYYNAWNKSSRLLKILGIGEMVDCIEKLEADFSYYIIPIRGRYSRAVDDYMLVLSRKRPKDNERAAVNFIKYGGILLNNCLRLFSDGLNFMRGRREYEAQAEELAGYKETLTTMIDNFRLSDIRGY
jgi:hypothetical protein